VADNCVIDKYGRVAARKGWTVANVLNGELLTGAVEALGELVDNAGDSTILAAGSLRLYKLTGTTLTTLTYGGGGIAPTITANNWQIVSLNSVAIFWQTGHDPLIYDPAVSTTEYRRLSERSGAAGTISSCHTAINAYGRVWCASTATDKSTVAWSDVMAPHVWTGGTSGTLDLRQVWPGGTDEVMGFAAHNNFLFIFGRRQILIYAGAEDPTTMRLSDTVVGVGCVTRDSIQSTGDDVLFMTDAGIVSLRRVIQEKSVPMVQASANIRSEIQDYIDAGGTVRSVFSITNAFYLLTFANNSKTYCFDTKGVLQSGALRVTTWNGYVARAYLETRDRRLFIGKAGYIGEYSGYTDDGATYRMRYFSTWIDFGAESALTILKSLRAYVLTNGGQTIIFKWAYDFADTYASASSTIGAVSSNSKYNISEYMVGEYGPYARMNELKVNCTSAGRLVQVGLETVVNGFNVAVQKIDIYSKEGRL